MQIMRNDTGTIHLRTEPTCGINNFFRQKFNCQKKNYQITKRKSIFDVQNFDNIQNEEKSIV